MELNIIPTVCTIPISKYDYSNGERFVISVSDAETFIKTHLGHNVYFNDDDEEETDAMETGEMISEQIDSRQRGFPITGLTVANHDRLAITGISSNSIAKNEVNTQMDLSNALPDPMSTTPNKTNIHLINAATSCAMVNGETAQLVKDSPSWSDMVNNVQQRKKRKLELVTDTPDSPQERKPLKRPFISKTPDLDVGGLHSQNLVVYMGNAALDLNEDSKNDLQSPIRQLTYTLDSVHKNTLPASPPATNVEYYIDFKNMRVLPVVNSIEQANIESSPAILFLAVLAKVDTEGFFTFLYFHFGDRFIAKYLDIMNLDILPITGTLENILKVAISHKVFLNKSANNIRTIIKKWPMKR
jgi:hypothetical protein